MALNKTTFGELLEAVSETNADLKYGYESIRGITITKEIIPAKADWKNASLEKYLVVRPHEFVYNPRTHGKRIGLGYNNAKEAFLISRNHTAFRIKKKAERCVLADYLYLYLNRDEWDREACFRSWGSSTEVFSWETFCEMPVILPDISIQRKYANIYFGIRDHLDSITRGIEQMECICRQYIGNLKNRSKHQKIGNYIKKTDRRNTDLQFGIEQVRGVSAAKKFIKTKANMSGVSLSPYRIIRPKEFCYAAVTSRNGNKISIAFNDSMETYLVSSSYESFAVAGGQIIPEYLFLFLKTEEFDRFARFHSWGSARETFAMEALDQFEIPVPQLEIQRNIVNIFHVCAHRRRLAERLGKLKKDICPVLIQGALREGAAAGFERGG